FPVRLAVCDGELFARITVWSETAHGNARGRAIGPEFCRGVGLKNLAAKIHTLAAHPGTVWRLPDPAVAVLSAGRANYQMLSLSGRFCEIAHRRLCARGGGEQGKKSKKAGARIQK